MLAEESDPPPDLSHLSLLASHYHDDHIAGLRSIFKKRVDPVNPDDRMQLEDRYRPGRVYEPVPDKKYDPSTQRFALFKEDVQQASMIIVPPQTRRVQIYPGGLRYGLGITRRPPEPVTISLGKGVNDIPIVAYVLASGQHVWHPVLGNIAVPPAGDMVDQNDRSVVLLLEYGSFRCLLGGDIGGNGGAGGGNKGANAADAAGKRYYSQHADVESVLGPAIETRFAKTEKWVQGKPKWKTAGCATVFKANHHGSSSSVDEHFLATVRPLVFVVSCGVKSLFHRHPTQAVLNRVTSQSWNQREGGTVPNSIASDGIYVTEIAQKVGGTPFPLTYDSNRVKIMGDVVIRPVDETIAALQAATAPPAELKVQVYGTGAQTGLTDPGTILRKTTSALNPAEPDSYYAIGPYWPTETY